MSIRVKINSIVSVGLAALIAVSFIAVSRFQTIEDSCQIYHKHVVSKQALVSDIQSRMGYGGAIHHLKDFVRSGDSESFQQFWKVHAELTAAIHSYRAIDGVSRLEQESLAQLEQMLDRYGEAITLVEADWRDGMTRDQIISKLQMINRLRSAIRPDGLLEQYRLALDGTADGDREPLREAIAAVTETVNNYEQVCEPISGEATELVSIRRVLAAYGAALADDAQPTAIQDPAVAGEAFLASLNSLEDILADASVVAKSVDQQIRIDDTPYLEALVGLAEHLEMTSMHHRKALAVSITASRTLIVAIGLIGLVLVAFLGSSVARVIVKPVDRLLGRAKAIAEGRLDGEDLPVMANDELGELTRATNHMRRQLEIRSTEVMSAHDSAQAANQAKSDFLANMSHEIRTPMSAILGYTEILEGDGDIESAPQPRLEAIRTIRRNGQHLLEIINDILDISKIEAGKLNVELLDTSLLGIVNDVVDLMMVRAQGKGLTMDLDVSYPVPEYIRTDPVRLKQILMNLIGNAVKFTEVGGIRVDVRVAKLTAKEPRVTIDVVDTGIGITGEQVSRLFNPFSQADTSTTRQFGGTGLGLVISKRLANKLGGDITVKSTPNRGSTFSVTIDATDKSRSPYIAIPPVVVFDLASVPYVVG